MCIPQYLYIYSMYVQYPVTSCRQLLRGGRGGRGGGEGGREGGGEGEREGGREGER